MKTKPNKTKSYFFLLLAAEAFCVAVWTGVLPRAAAVVAFRAAAEEPFD
jgi:hypothetical protein